MADEQEVTLDPTGERFDPDAAGGALIEAEHQARYQFAAYEQETQADVQLDPGIPFP